MTLTILTFALICCWLSHTIGHHQGFRKGMAYRNRLTLKR